MRKLILSFSKLCKGPSKYHIFSGDATLASFSVTTQPEETRKRIGYCPQFDAHFPNLTGREHVELYATIRGIPKEHVATASASKLAEVGLSESDSDKLSSSYSGGMRRKLSVAIATVGNPEVSAFVQCFDSDMVVILIPFAST